VRSTKDTEQALSTTLHPDGDALTIRIVGNVAVSAEEVIAAVRDFSDRREAVFPAVSMKRMAVHSLGNDTADVTEGTRAGPFVFWERCRYDWSQPGRVVATVTDSNVYAHPGSAWVLTAEAADHGSRIVMTWTRRFVRRPLGRFMGLVYRHDGRRAFTKYAAEILANLEAGAARAAVP
jgi:Polyketide cyclase / dehydrase and lipid transport